MIEMRGRIGWLKEWLECGDIWKRKRWGNTDRWSGKKSLSQPTRKDFHGVALCIGLRRREDARSQTQAKQGIISSFGASIEPYTTSVTGQELAELTASKRLASLKTQPNPGDNIFTHAISDIVLSTSMANI